jgi:hypothetical protein
VPPKHTLTFTTYRYIPDDEALHSHRYESIKFSICFFIILSIYYFIMPITMGAV